MHNFYSFEYIKFPMNIFSNYQLSAGSKILFAEILSLAKKDGYCYASNRYLADSLAVSTRTITNRIRELKEENLIKIENSKNRNRRLFITNKSQYE